MTRQPHVPRAPGEVKVYIVPPNHDPMRPGLYRTRLAKKAVWVPVQLLQIDGPRDEAGHLIGDVEYRLRIDDEPVDWTDHLGLTGEPIDADEYRFLIRAREHDKRYGTELADPRKPIDLNALPPVYQRRTP